MKILTIALAVVALLFAILYFTSRAKLNDAELAAQKADSLLHKLPDHNMPEVAGRELIYTAPIDYDNAITRYVPRFHKTFDPTYTPDQGGKVPFGVWVDRLIISKPLSDVSVDGFYIVPIQYDADTTVGSKAFKKDDVNFMIVFTKASTIDQRATVGTHAPLAASAFDFNQPCPHLPCP